MNNTTKPKWTSISQYVDLDTGEVLTKNNITDGTYTIIKKQTLKKFHHETQCGICYITNECRRSKQTTLF